jgi:hypothetical protein
MLDVAAVTRRSISLDGRCVDLERHREATDLGDSDTVGNR